MASGFCDVVFSASRHFKTFWLRTSLNSCFPALGFGLKGFTGFAVPCFRVFKTLTNALDFKDF